MKRNIVSIGDTVFFKRSFWGESMFSAPFLSFGSRLAGYPMQAVVGRYSPGDIAIVLDIRPSDGYQWCFILTERGKLAWVFEECFL